MRLVHFSPKSAGGRGGWLCPRFACHLPKYSAQRSRLLAVRPLTGIHEQAAPSEAERKTGTRHSNTRNAGLPPIQVQARLRSRNKEGAPLSNSN